MKKQIEFEPVSTVIDGTQNPPKISPKFTKAILSVFVTLLVIAAYFLGARSCKATCSNLTGLSATDSTSKPKTAQKDTKRRPSPNEMIMISRKFIFAHSGPKIFDNLPPPLKKKKQTKKEPMMHFIGTPVGFEEKNGKLVDPHPVNVNPEAAF